MSDEALIYRHVVRFDRETNQWVEAQARAWGISAAAFVQAHADRIRSMPPRQRIGDAEPATTTPSIVAEANALGITVTDCRIYQALRSRADAAGLVCMSYGQIAEASRLEPGNVDHRIKRLMAAGLVIRMRKATAHAAATYRVRERAP